MLTLDALTIRQGDFSLTADWSVAPAERVAIIGPSGGGKSTLLMTIAGFIPLTSGRLLWQGRGLGGVPPGQRPVSMLFQDQNFFPHLTEAQNLGLGLSSDLRLASVQVDQVESALRRVGLEGMGERNPSELSGGQQGRAALARALLRARPVLLLDEPFAALGPALKAEMLDLVAEVASETGAAALMVTHDPADARRVADKTGLVADGVAQAPQPAAALCAEPPQALRYYLGTA